MYACGNAPDSELNQLPHEYAEVLKTALPGISELTVFDKEIITLNDGSKGIAWKLKWKWTDNVTYLQSAAVASPREYKVVSCFGTDIYRQDNSLNLMLDQCKKLMFTAP